MDRLMDFLCLGGVVGLAFLFEGDTLGPSLRSEKVAKLAVVFYKTRSFWAFWQ